MTNETPRRGRPKGSSNFKQDTRERLIRSGLELLTEKGFIGTGLDEALKRAGVPKGSFYHYFKSKEAYGLAVLASYHSYFAKKLDHHLCNTELLPLDRIISFMEAAKAGMAKFNFSRGCLVGNLGQEVNLLPDSYRSEITSIFANWEGRIAMCLREATAQKQIADTHDCDWLAKVFWSGWEGAVARAKLECSAQPLEDYVHFYISSIAVSSPR